MYLHAASGFAGAWTNRLFTQEMFYHLLHMSFRSILPCERAGRAESPATRSDL